MNPARGRPSKRKRRGGTRRKGRKGSHHRGPGVRHAPMARFIDTPMEKSSRRSVGAFTKSHPPVPTPDTRPRPAADRIEKARGRRERKARKARDDHRLVSTWSGNRRRRATAAIATKASTPATAKTKRGVQSHTDMAATRSKMATHAHGW